MVARDWLSMTMNNVIVAVALQVIYDKALYVNCI